MIAGPSEIFKEIFLSETNVPVAPAMAIVDPLTGVSTEFILPDANGDGPSILGPARQAPVHVFENYPVGRKRL
jgi:hypothetical protein